MDRRTFIGTLAGALVALLPPAGAQPAAKVWRIGILNGNASGSPAGTLSAVLKQSLQELGYREGKNVAYVDRAADGRLERLPQLAAELVGLGVDVIVTQGSEATRAAKQATASIPIIFVGPSYPVEEGLVASFARPGGNITGITLAQSDHVAKQLQLLRDIVPTLTDVAVLWSPANAGTAFNMRNTERTAASLRLMIQSVPIGSAEDVEPALDTIARRKPGALVLLGGVVINAHMQRFSDLALKLRAPSISTTKVFTERGLLMSYGADIRELQRRVAGYVDRILKGAKPADLAVERPTKFELVINMKTAKALGLTIPQTLLLRADEVIN
jgi:putative tryptophan/tyrosine transport system substrate-binding protein